MIFSFVILLLNLLSYSQTQIIYDPWPKHFIADQARLNISNHNVPDQLRIQYNLEICYNCSYDEINETFPMNFTDSVLLSTVYRYEFRIINLSSSVSICNINQSKFYQEGTYLLNISLPSNCFITEIKGPQSDMHYWSPIIVTAAIIIAIILVTQIWDCLKRSPRFVRKLPMSVQENLTANDLTISLPQTTNLIANEQNNDIINTLMFDSEFGSTRRLRANTAHRIIPKRLRSLDTFRGLSLMIMILVSYGGKKKNG